MHRQKSDVRNAEASFDAGEYLLFAVTLNINSGKVKS